MSEEKTIDASPTKELFINILTRDIGIKECILDLLDNSIHNTIISNKMDVTKIFEGKEKRKSLSGTYIDITFDSDKFEIDDNCGGISIEDAEKEVFRFGRVEHMPTGKGLGVYGIGMKRAFFKLGREISLFSKTAREELGVIIDVDKWLKEKDKWSYEFDYADKLKKQAPKPERGVTINITRLQKNVKKKFETPFFVSDLVDQISETYALFIDLGLSITVNKKKVPISLPKFAEITQQRTHSEFNDVNISMMIGITPKTDRSPRGWYIFCNGRMVIGADKTYITGWGDKAEWNPKYNHFLGYLFLTSNKVENLPWNTAKEGIEFESPVYQHALGQMRAYGKPVRKYLADSYSSLDIESIPERELLESASSTSIKTVAKRNKTQFRPNIPKSVDTGSVNILYKRPKEQVEIIKKSIKKPRFGPNKIGEYTFDYYINNVL